MATDTRTLSRTAEIRAVARQDVPKSMSSSCGMRYSYSFAYPGSVTSLRDLLAMLRPCLTKPSASHAFGTASPNDDGSEEVVAKWYYWRVTQRNVVEY